MKYLALVIALVVMSPAAAAQNPQCKCTVNACNVISGPYLPGTIQPTLCSLQKNGVGAGSAASTTTAPTITAGHCSPDALPDVGPAGSVYCVVPLPPFPAANGVSLTMTGQNNAGQSAVGPTWLFDNVVNFTNQVPASPANLRIQ